MAGNPIHGCTCRTGCLQTLWLCLSNVQTYLPLTPAQEMKLLAAILFKLPACSSRLVITVRSACVRDGCPKSSLQNLRYKFIFSNNPFVNTPHTFANFTFNLVLSKSQFQSVIFMEPLSHFSSQGLGGSTESISCCHCFGSQGILQENSTLRVTT